MAKALPNPRALSSVTRLCPCEVRLIDDIRSHSAGERHPQPHQHAADQREPGRGRARRRDEPGELVRVVDALAAGHAVLDCTGLRDRKSTRLNSSHVKISYAVFCLKKKMD